MNTVVQILSLNWDQLFMLGVMVFLFVKKEQLLSRLRGQQALSVNIQKIIMAGGVALIGFTIILIGDLRLAAERSNHQRDLKLKDSTHQGELMLKQAELRILKAEIADFKN